MKDYKVEDARSSGQVRQALGLYLEDVQTATTEQIVKALGLKGSGLDYLEVFRTEGWLSKRRSTGRDGGYLWYLKKAIPPALLQQRPRKKQSRMVLDEVRALLEKEGILSLEQLATKLELSQSTVRHRLGVWKKKGVIGFDGKAQVCWYVYLPHMTVQAQRRIQKEVDAWKEARAKPARPAHPRKTSSSSRFMRGSGGSASSQKESLKKDSTLGSSLRRGSVWESSSAEDSTGEGALRGPWGKAAGKNSSGPTTSKRAGGKQMGQEGARPRRLELERARAAKLLQASGRRASRQADSFSSQEAANTMAQEHGVALDLTEALAQQLARLGGKARTSRELARMVSLPPVLERSPGEVRQALEQMQAQGLAERRWDAWVAPGSQPEILVIHADLGWSNKEGEYLGQLEVCVQEGQRFYLDHDTGRRWYSLADARTDMASMAYKAS